MAQSNVEVQGIEWLLALLTGLETPERFLSDQTREALALLYEKVRDYPAEPAGSRYERTYNFRDSWEAILTLTSGELGRMRSSGPPYNRFVMDGESQASIHAGRWQTIQAIADESEAPIAELYEKALQAMIDRTGIRL